MLEAVYKSSPFGIIPRTSMGKKKQFSLNSAIKIIIHNFLLTGIDKNVNLILNPTASGDVEHPGLTILRAVSAPQKLWRTTGLMRLWSMRLLCTYMKNPAFSTIINEKDSSKYCMFNLKGYDSHLLQVYVSASKLQKPACASNASSSSKLCVLVARDT